MYEQDVMALLTTLFRDSDYALLSGGSMMYIDAVCNGIDDIPTVDDATRATLKQRLAEEGLEALCEELRRLDPEHYAMVDRQNPRRVVHALEICHMTGQTYTSFRKAQKKERPFGIVKIGLNRDRQELYDRINRRVDQMMAEDCSTKPEAMLPLSPAERAEHSRLQRTIQLFRRTVDSRRSGRAHQRQHPPLCP